MNFSDYLPKIIGRNGDSKRTIEKETKTQLLIPKKGQTGDVGMIAVVENVSILVSTYLTML